MTWKEFKEWMEREGVTDETIIRYIDFSGAPDSVHFFRRWKDLRRMKDAPRNGRAPGVLCALCGQDCGGWQDCVAKQRARRPPKDPADYAPLYDTAKVWSPEQIAAAEAHNQKVWPFLAGKDLAMFTVLYSTAQVSARIGGSAGSGWSSKFLKNCELKAARYGIITASNSFDGEEE